MPINELSLRPLEEYKTRHMIDAGEDHAEQGRRAITLNSYLRSARSIFPPFVIPAPRFGKKEPAKPGQIIFRQLYQWLRKNRVDVEGPLYIFRKEAESILFEQTDLFDLAAEFLNDLRIARRYYVSRKRKLLVEVSDLVSREE